MQGLFDFKDIHVFDPADLSDFNCNFADLSDFYCNFYFSMFVI